MKSVRYISEMVWRIVYILPVLSLMLSCSGYRGTGEADSRQAALDSFKTECVRYYEQGFYDSLIVRGVPFMEMSIASRDTQSVLYAAVFMAQACIVMENADAFSGYISVIEDYSDTSKISDENLLTMYYNVLGINSLKIDLDYSDALSYFTKSLELDRMRGDTVNMVVSLANISYIYLMKEDVSGMSYASMAYELSRDESIPDYIKCHTSLLMAQMCYLAGNYDDSRHYLETGVSIAETNGFLYHYTLIHLIRANLYRCQGMNDEAEEEYLKAHDYIAYAEPTAVVQLCLDFGDFCASQKRYAEAADLMEKGVEISYGHDSPAMRGDLLRCLSEIYAETGDVSRSLSYYKRFVSFQDSISAVEREQEFGKLLLRLKNAEHSNEMKSKEVEVLKANKRLIVTAGILVIIIIAMAFGWMMYMRQKKTYKALVAQHQSYIQRIDREEAKKKMPKDDYKDLYERIDRAMKQEYIYRQKDLTQERLAEMMQSNRTYVSKAINTFAGMSFSSYVNMYRVSEATRLISSPEFDMPFKQLADMLGYSSVYVFSKSFQKETGTAPSVYRKEVMRARSEETATE